MSINKPQFAPSYISLRTETYEAMQKRILDLESRLESIRNHFEEYPEKELYAYLFEAMTGLPLSKFTRTIEATDGDAEDCYKRDNTNDPKLATTDYATYVKYAQPQL